MEGVDAMHMWADPHTGLEGKIDVEALPWIDISVGGNRVKILRVSPETQHYTLLIHAPAGQVNQRHFHSGPADFYVIEGGIDYRAGHMKAGEWAYEPAGALHEATTHPVDTLYLAHVYGPIVFLKPDDSIDFIQDWKVIQNLAAAARA
jgi:quercetin dioxygenase-like cupin family protein